MKAFEFFIIGMSIGCGLFTLGLLISALLIAIFKHFKK